MVTLTGDDPGLVLYEGKRFWAQSSGFIQCESCNKLWCRHIMEMIKANADSESIFESIEPVEYIVVSVPMIPTANQWARVKLEDAYKGYPVLNATYIGHENEDEIYRLGFIHPGEGRNVLRSMLFDWFQGNTLTKSSLNCSSLSHKFREQVAWEKDMRDAYKKITQYWSVWATGKCLSCSSKSSDFDDDLIPEADSRRVW